MASERVDPSSRCGFPDARQALKDLAERGGPSVELDEVTSDKVFFATVTDPDGNAITIVEVRQGVTL